MAVAVALAGGCWTAPAKAESAWAAQTRRHEPILPLVAVPDLDPAKVALGRNLFFDPILSGDGTISCATCHDLRLGGADGEKVSTGIAGGHGEANAPTVFNSFLNVAQFWDGRAASLEQQVDGPLTNPVEMATDWPTVLDRLDRRPYRDQFRAAYGGAATQDSVRDALATYEKSLVSLNAPFDRWLGGDETALTEAQKKGYDLFKSYGCASCHQGANVGGNMFQKFGFFGNWFADRGHETQADQGRFNVTNRIEDRYVFKVPSLRLVTLTAPYFHDGSVPDLKQAIRLMGRYQLGRDIPAGDVTLIVAFLSSLVDPAQLPQPPR